MIGISTAWNAKRHTSGRQMVRELLDLGFDTLELSVHVTPAMVEEVLDMVKAGEVKVSGLHNYCPLPDGIDLENAARNVVPLSSPSTKENRRAISLTMGTIEWAARLGAGVVVLHLGIVPIQARQKEAIKLMTEGKRDEAKLMVTEDLIERSMLRQPYLDNVIAALGEIVPFAEQHGVKLGLETRYYMPEIPSLDEFQMIFKNIQSPILNYWHDTGHAHVMETLGVAGQDDFLRKYADRLIGVHIHDAVGGSDHRPLGTGDIDFKQVTQYVKPDTEIVLEIHGTATEEDLIASREKALQLLGDNEGC